MNISDVRQRLNAQLKTDYTDAQVTHALAKYQAVQQANERQAVVNEFAPYKSSLLVRLLEGKDAYAHPVPRAHSYPAYSWMEDEAGTPHRVKVLFQGAEAIVDQTRVDIKDRNQAARAIDALMKGPFDPAAFGQACADGPIWKIKYPHWPVFCLTIQRMPAGFARKEWFDRRLERTNRGLTPQEVIEGFWMPEIVAGEGEFLTFTAMTWTLLRNAEDWALTPIYSVP